MVRRHLRVQQCCPVHLAFCVELSHTHFFLVGQARRHGPSGHKQRWQVPELEGAHHQPRHNLVADPQHQHPVKHLVGERDGGRLRDDVPAEQAQLHPGLSLGHAIAHGGHRPRHLCRAPNGFQG